MTFLGFLGLIAGICVLADGAFDRGLLASSVRNLSPAAILLIRIVEVVTAGSIFLMLGFALSKCS